MTVKPRFTALILSLPTRDKAVRMRVWRTLRAMGCGVLRDGVYLLPAQAPRVAEFINVESAVRAAKGFAMTVEILINTSAQFDAIRKLFDRTKAYTELVREIVATGRMLTKPLGRHITPRLARLRKQFEEIVAGDYFPGQAKLQAEAHLTELEREAARVADAGEPKRSKRVTRRLVAANYRSRTWATRKNPWVDRLASAWVIKRFIDPQARFAWIDKPRALPRRTVGFDFDGAEFTHAGNHVTVEVLIESFGLTGDSALGKIAAAVHYLDAGGIPVEDARGIESILAGIRRTAHSDDELLLEAIRVFDFLYSAFQQEGAQP
jgi:hypothetical protein